MRSQGRVRTGGRGEPEASLLRGWCDDPAAAPASIPSDREGTFELDSAHYDFLVVRCDLSGGSPDGIFVRGAGTAPDGRRVTVEVERLSPGKTVNERAGVIFGGIVDGITGPRERPADPTAAGSGTRSATTPLRAR